MTEASPTFDFIDEPEPAAPQASKRRTVFAGYTAGQLFAGIGVLGLVVWGMWVTRTITADPPQRIVKANLSGIVGDYVQAQARSTNPPQEVEAQMRQFMASLDTELQRRSAAGQVVLVGEAVLSKGVPDITPEVVKAVYASGVGRPQPASAQQMMRSGPAASPMSQGLIPQVPVPQLPTGAAPMAASPFGPWQGFAPDDAGAARQGASGQGAAGASVSSFGGGYAAGNP
ncbi:MAG: hypothetical protein E2586_23330 [Novosphingobium sp.]|uniref:type-F conjugative transfer system protein TrbI n=1 Tax=Novosphingobium sp. TaxID=1874826 RepID=UPI0012CC780A|nr:type-F conjugative transfer system protein TrbI [Novosphingobium sp.]MPS71410.1 hypothetical protein [Novosphingobium sp.]